MDIDKDAHFFLDKYVKGGKAQRQQPYVKYKPVRRGQTTTTGTPSPTLCAILATLKTEDAGDGVYVS